MPMCIEYHLRMPLRYLQEPWIGLRGETMKIDISKVYDPKKRESIAKNDYKDK